MPMISRFTRVLSQGRRFIAEVDGLRFVAIAAVVLFHLRADARHYTIVLPGLRGAPPVPSSLDVALLTALDIGHYGVQLFFVLSGFLLALPFAKWRLGMASRPALRVYYLRRLTRLEPPYIVSMLLLFVAGIAAAALALALSAAGLRPTTLRGIPNHLPNLLASLVYQHNLIYGEASVVNRVAWSLEIEVQFYVLAPLLASVFSVQGRFLRRALLASVVLAAPWLREMAPAHAVPWLGLSLPGFIEYFLAGFLLADFFIVDWREKPACTRGWDLASVVGWPLLGVLLITGRARWLIAPSILLAYVGAFRGRWSAQLFTRPWITAFGGMCYSMYLLHYFVISGVGVVAHTLGMGSSFTARLLLEAVVALPAVAAVTAAFFVFLERPCMDPRWPSRAIAWVDRRVSGVPSAGSTGDP